MHVVAPPLHLAVAVAGMHAAIVGTHVVVGTHAIVVGMHVVVVETHAAVVGTHVVAEHLRVVVAQTHVVVVVVAAVGMLWLLLMLHGVVLEVLAFCSHSKRGAPKLLSTQTRRMVSSHSRNEI